MRPGAALRPLLARPGGFLVAGVGQAKEVAGCVLCPPGCPAPPAAALGLPYLCGRSALSGSPMAGGQRSGVSLGLGKVEGANLSRLGASELATKGDWPSDPAKFPGVCVPFRARLVLRRASREGCFGNFLPELGGRKFLGAAAVAVYL